MQTIMEQAGNVTIFNLVGNFDGGKDCQKTTGKFQELLDKGSRDFVINFSLIRWINSNGVGCLIAARKLVDTVGGRMVLCGLNPRSLSTIYTMRLEEVFPVADTLETALGLLAERKARAAEAGGRSKEKPARPRGDKIV